jgi:hypothetical protein
VYVIESVVDVSKITRENGKVITKESKKVEKNKHVFVAAVAASTPMKVIDLPEEKKNTDWFQRNTELTQEIKQAELEAEKNQAVGGTDVTSSPENMDVIKQTVREQVMENIQENEVLQKIDDTFPSPTPEEHSQSNSDSSSTVLGADVVADPFDSPTGELTEEEVPVFSTDIGGPEMPFLEPLFSNDDNNATSNVENTVSDTPTDTNTDIPTESRTNEQPGNSDNSTDSHDNRPSDTPEDSPTDSPVDTPSDTVTDTPSESYFNNQSSSTTQNDTLSEPQPSPVEEQQ